MKWVASAILSPCSSMDFTKSIHWRGEGPQGFTTFRIQGLATATRATHPWENDLHDVFFPHRCLLKGEGISKHFKTYI